MISRQPTPTEILKGVDTSIRLDLRSDDGTPVTVDSANVTIYKGTTAIVGPVAATIAAGVATYTILGTDTEDQAAGVDSADWSIQWTDTVVSLPELDAGTYGTIRQAAVFVLAPLFCPITDDDLTDDAPSLAEMVPPTDGTYEGFRVAAFRRCVRKLKRQGKIASLILDADSLVDYLIADTLAAIYREHTTSVGDPRYRELAAFYADRALDEWNAISFQYDRKAQGGPTGQDGSESPAASMLYTSRPPRRLARNTSQRG